MPLKDITGFAISAGEDQAVVIHLGDDVANDLVLTLRGNACAAELVSLIAQTLNTTYVTTWTCACAISSGLGVIFKMRDRLLLGLCLGLG